MALNVTGFLLVALVGILSLVAALLGIPGTSEHPQRDTAAVIAMSCLITGAFPVSALVILDVWLGKDIAQKGTGLGLALLALVLNIVLVVATMVTVPSSVLLVIVVVAAQIAMIVAGHALASQGAERRRMTGAVKE